MEKWDVYNVNREKINKVINRGEKLQHGEYRLVVHACIFDDKGHMLIQQRQSFKNSWANMWDISVGGCVQSGETSRQAIQREVFEELGLDINFTNILPKLTINFEGGFDDIYLVIIDKQIKIDELKLQYEEVQTARWATLEEIEKMIKTGEFIPYYQNLIKLMFDMNNSYGCFNEICKS